MDIDGEAIGSHRAALAEACARTVGPIIEVGAGTYSTPMLLEIARTTGRPLVTVEHNPDWRPALADGHYVTDSLEDGVRQYAHFGVALIDGPAEERAVAIRLLLPKCALIVIHDTESMGDYPGLAEVMAKATHRRDFPMPTTTVISNLRTWE